MKKLIIILIVICLLFAGVVGYLNRDALFAGTGADTAVPTAQEVDLDAVYALHAPDETVMTVDGKTISWDEYYGWLSMKVAQTQNYFAQLASYYGLALQWSDPVGEDPAMTYAKNAVDGVDSTVMQFLAIEGLGEKNGLSLSEDSLAAIAAQRESDKTAICGEGATEEDFTAALAERHITPPAYERMSKVNYEYQENFTNIFGEDGAKISDEEAMKYLEDGGYTTAAHILFMTVDPSTGEALDEAGVKAKKQQADKLYAELSAITDSQELLKRFGELKEQYCEDAGKTGYPDGDVFAPGTMDKTFEATCATLEEYGLSEPVESDYGYHIILRLPNSADRTVSYSDAGTALSARSLCANAAYAKLLEEYSAGMKVEHAQGFEAPDLLEYIKK